MKVHDFVTRIEKVGVVAELDAGVAEAVGPNPPGSGSL